MAFPGTQPVSSWKAAQWPELPHRRWGLRERRGILTDRPWVPGEGGEPRWAWGVRGLSRGRRRCPAQTDGGSEEEATIQGQRPMQGEAGLWGKCETVVKTARGNEKAPGAGVRKGTLGSFAIAGDSLHLGSQVHRSGWAKIMGIFWAWECGKARPWLPWVGGLRAPGC